MEVGPSSLGPLPTSEGSSPPPDRESWDLTEASQEEFRTSRFAVLALAVVGWAALGLGVNLLVGMIDSPASRNPFNYAGLSYLLLAGSFCQVWSVRRGRRGAIKLEVSMDGIMFWYRGRPQEPIFVSWHDPTLRLRLTRSAQPGSGIEGDCFLKCQGQPRSRIRDGAFFGVVRWATVAGAQVRRRTEFSGWRSVAEIRSPRD